MMIYAIVLLKRYVITDSYVNADEFGLQSGFAILQQHRNDLAQIPVNFVERGALGMRTGEARYRHLRRLCTGEARYIGDVGAGIGAPFDDSVVVPHAGLPGGEGLAEA